VEAVTTARQKKTDATRVRMKSTCPEMGCWGNPGGECRAPAGIGPLRITRS
jgi:hypothetical protein